MKRFIAIILLMSFPVFGFADEVSNRNDALELLTLMDADTMVDNYYSRMEQVMISMNQQLGVMPSEQELFDKYKSRMLALMKEEMNWERMQESMIDLYLKHYSEKEINDMLTFYKSNTGKAMMEKMPEVRKGSMFIGQSMVNDFMPKIQALAVELKNEIEKARKNQE